MNHPIKMKNSRIILTHITLSHIFIPFRLFVRKDIYIFRPKDRIKGDGSFGCFFNPLTVFFGKERN